MKAITKHYFLIITVALLMTAGCTDVPIAEFYTGILSGQVQDEVSRSPVADVLITTSPGTGSQLTDTEGNFTLEEITEGNYTVFALKDGYNKGIMNILIEKEQTTEIAILIRKASDEVGTLSGTIYDTGGNPIANANISTTPGSSAVISDAAGQYSLGSVPAGNYTINVRKPGYSELSLPVTVNAGQVTTADLILGYAEDLNHNPADLSYLTPLNGATNVSTSGTSLQWSCSDPDDDSLYYDVYFWESSGSITLVADSITDATYAPALSAATTYYWIIAAKDPRGGFKLGTIWQFTTQ